MSRISVQDLEVIFQQGENEYTEFKCGTINPDAIAKCIAAFANTHGGRIIIGYNDYKNEFIGSSPKDRRGIEKAVSFLEHPPEIDIYNIQHLDHHLLVVDVKKNTNSFTYFKGALYTRTNDRILPMSSSDLQKSFAQNTDPKQQRSFHMRWSFRRILRKRNKRTEGELSRRDKRSSPGDCDDVNPCSRRCS